MKKFLIIACCLILIAPARRTQAAERFVYGIPVKEYDILCRIVEAEATGGTVEQKVNVASCILARVESEHWPNTIEKVVFDKGQFTPITDGRYYSVRITDQTRKAVAFVLKLGKTHDCEFFCSYASWNSNNWHRRHLKEVFRDGEHIYSN